MAMVLRGKCAARLGYSARSETIEKALARNIIDRGWTDLGEMLKETDLLVLASPISAILDLIPRLPALISGPLQLIDLGSSKSQIVAAMKCLPESISPIGGHPMCGKETSGLDAADEQLYRDRIFVLTPFDRTLPETLSLAKELVAAVGSRLLILDPDRHDRAVAVISHVPYLTSVALVDAALHADDDLVWQLAASGFRDSTRLAASNVKMMQDILTSNRPAVLEALARAQDSLAQLAELLEQGNDAELTARLETSRRQRAGLYQ
jgi:prephenate dehydrogenase